MKGLLKLFIVVLFSFSLTGCIGEEYDFTPPTVTLVNSELELNSIQLEEANINWRSDKYYEKETKDILSLAREQKQISVYAGQKEDLTFDSEDFTVYEISVSVWKKDKKVYKKIDLELKEDRSFFLPEEKGEYVIEVNLQTDNGSAQYVGNVIIH